MKKDLLAEFDELADHRRRAAAVAGLLRHCDREDLEDELLADAASLICHELKALRECEEKIQKAVMR